MVPPSFHFFSPHSLHPRPSGIPSMAWPRALVVLCFLASSLCLSSASALSSSATLPRQDYAADFFYLTLTWPGSYCRNVKGGCCKPLNGMPASDLFVYALEPYSTITGEPATACASECRFYINQLVNLIDDLFAYWPDVNCPSNNGYNQWNQTWCTYGICSNLSEIDYFQRALDLRAKVNLLSLLKRNGIKPSSRKLYQLSAIKEVLIAEFGFSTVIECTRKGTQISRIHICVNSKATSIITCPIQVEETCNPWVWFPPFTLDMLQDGGLITGNPIELPSQNLTAV